jgi:hypothetical protein
MFGRSERKYVGRITVGGLYVVVAVTERGCSQENVRSRLRCRQRKSGMYWVLGKLAGGEWSE